MLVMVVFYYPLWMLVRAAGGFWRPQRKFEASCYGLTAASNRVSAPSQGMAVPEGGRIGAMPSAHPGTTGTTGQP